MNKEIIKLSRISKKFTRSSGNITVLKNINFAIEKGEIISLSNMEFLRPAPKNSLPPYEFNKLIGKKLKKNIKKGAVLYKKDII